MHPRAGRLARNRDPRRRRHAKDRARLVRQGAAVGRLATAATGFDLGEQRFERERHAPIDAGTG
jgi:hypothetical protein